MNDFFDRHGKKFIAVVMSLLMVAFILPTFGGRGGGGGGHVGTIGGTRLSLSDVQAAGGTLRSLDRVVIQDRQGKSVPLSQVMFFDPQIGRQLEQNPLQWYLLTEEANRAGVIPGESQIDQLFDGPQSPLKLLTDDGRELSLDKVNPAVKDGLRADFRRALAVRTYFIRSQAKVKISRPLVDEELARDAQQIKARVVVFSAADYEKQVAPPTDADLKRQFDAYAAFAPGLVNDSNPFGFGYRVPDKAAVQWLAVPDAEVAKIVEATKTPELWAEEAILYYKRHPQEFQTPTTQPTDKATTRPYADVSADALTKLRAPLIEQKKRTAAGLIARRMSADYDAAAKGPTTQAAVTAYGVPFGSFEYLQKLADDVQKQTGVRPTAVAPAGLLSRDDLTKQPGFGKSDLATAGGSSALSGPAFLFASLKALRPDSTTATLELGQPTTPLAGADGLYVARAVAAEPAHPPASLTDVRPDVERDVRRGQAFAKATEAAQAALDKAKSAGGFAKAGLTVQTTDWFGATDPTVPGLTGPDAKADFSGGLPGPAFETLRGLTSAADLPRTTLAKLRRDGKAVAIEVFDIKTALTTTIEPMYRGQAQQQVAQALMIDPTAPPTANPEASVIEQWFGLDAVSRRVGYVPEASQAPKPATPSAPNAPGSPFIPG